MIYHSEISYWVSDLGDIKDYVHIKVWNVLQFYQLEGRKTVLSRYNMIPIERLRYVIFSPSEKRYYIRTFNNYSLNRLYFRRWAVDNLSEDEACESLRRYIIDENVYLLFNKRQQEEMRIFLQRLWKSRFEGEGTVRYKDYINLLDQSLQLEDYREYGKNLIGYKTVEHQFEIRISEIWNEIYKKSEL